MDDDALRIALYGHETGGGFPTHIKSIGAFQSWEVETKRDFTDGELTKGQWRKEGNHNYTFIVTFSQDGTLSEYNMYNPSHRNEGTWELCTPFNHRHYIRITIMQHEDGTPFTYRMFLMANTTKDYHSAVETRNESIHAYFKLFHKL